METVIITGGTGLIGTALSKLLLSRGFQVIIFSRNPKAHRTSSPGISFASWNIDEQSVNEEAFQKERQVVLEERRMRVDNEPQSLMRDGI